jgi:hypothetical protein
MPRLEWLGDAYGFPIPSKFFEWSSEPIANWPAKSEPKITMTQAELDAKIREAVELEREECAEEVDSLYISGIRDQAAARIRARGTKP